MFFFCLIFGKISPNKIGAKIANKKRIFDFLFFCFFVAKSYKIDLILIAIKTKIKYFILNNDDTNAEICIALLHVAASKNDPILQFSVEQHSSLFRYKLFTESKPHVQLRMHIYASVNAPFIVALPYFYLLNYITFKKRPL